ncbi:uncharacterized protein LOC122249835 [Penaeus japonicus]|uniref:uncharacterized protein LOC122249835 n=1 Tax=Penaeus japonicus TaxID=27405 RepID=UPI001C710F70|nr:uncharacterized protein LOC122249835 [Penaeus japonicus]
MPRRRLTSLKTITVLETARLSLNAIENILLQEQDEDINWREWVGHCKRKRSYSCGDEERGNSPKKKMRFQKIQEDVGSSNKRKRNREDGDENVEMANQRKRIRLGNDDGEGDAQETDTCPHNKRKKIEDDACVTYSTSDLLFSVLKKYFHGMPSTLWNEYAKMLTDEAVKRTRFRDEGKKYFERILDYTFCGKLTRWSTSAIEECSFGLEETLYRKLRCCRKLESLTMTIMPYNDSGLSTAILTLQRLQYLVTLALLPPTRYSFHWAVKIVGQHCPRLRELKVVYNGDLFSDGEGIADLQHCHSISSLWLFNFGRLCETKGVCCLLRTLTDLKALFHKELPNAILEMTKDRRGGILQLGEECPSQDYDGSSADAQPAKEKHLGLERIDLCWYERGTGYQLVYIPSSFLLRIAQACPRIKSLNLIGPPCLSEIVQRLPQLRVIVLQQASLASSLGSTLQEADVSVLTVLRVSDVWDVNHDLVSAVARSCPALQVLSVTSSSLEARGHLVTPPRRAPFPFLREVTLVPSALAGRPSLISPSVWQLGASLTRYVLGEAPHIVSIHLHYKDSDVPLADRPSESDLEAVLCRATLRDLTLEWPPAISPTLVERLVEACPALTTLAAITTWPLSPRQCADVIASYGRRIDIT